MFTAPKRVHKISSIFLNAIRHLQLRKPDADTIINRIVKFYEFIKIFFSFDYLLEDISSSPTHVKPFYLLLTLALPSMSFPCH